MLSQEACGDVVLAERCGWRRHHRCSGAGTLGRRASRSGEQRQNPQSRARESSRSWMTWVHAVLPDHGRGAAAACSLLMVNGVTQAVYRSLPVYPCNSGHSWCSRIVTAVHFRRPTTRLRMRSQPTFSRLGPIPKFVSSNAELPFVIVRGELRGSGTLVKLRKSPTMSRGPWHSALLDSAALHRLANFKPLELRVIQIQWLVVSCATMCCTESFRFSPCFKDGTVFPHRVGSIKCLILSFRALEKVKLHEAWHLLEVTVARLPVPP